MNKSKYPEQQGHKLLIFSSPLQAGSLAGGVHKNNQVDCESREMFQSAEVLLETEKETEMVDPVTVETLDAWVPPEEADIVSDWSDTEWIEPTPKLGKKRKRSKIINKCASPQSEAKDIFPQNESANTTEVIKTPKKCKESEVNSTPEKPKETTNEKLSTNLKIAGRDLGCNTPHTKKPRMDRAFYANLSMSIHSWALFEGFLLDANEHGQKAEILTDEHMERIVQFAGPDGINLLSEKTNAKKLYKLRFKNGAKRSDRYVGNSETGFVGPDGLHRYPDNCPFQHCHSLPEWFKKNCLQFESNPAEDNCFVKSPSSLAEMKLVVKKLQTDNKNLQKSLFVENERSSTFMDKLQTLRKGQPEKEAPPGSFPCPLCGKVFTRPDSVKKHVRKIHPDEKSPLELPKDVSVSCQFCKKRLASRYVKSHEKICESRFKYKQKDTVNKDRSGGCEDYGVMKMNMKEPGSPEMKICGDCSTVKDTLPPVKKVVQDKGIVRYFFY